MCLFRVSTEQRIFILFYFFVRKTGFQATCPQLSVIKPNSQSKVTVSDQSNERTVYSIPASKVTKSTWQWASVEHLWACRDSRLHVRHSLVFTWPRLCTWSRDVPSWGWFSTRGYCSVCSRSRNVLSRWRFSAHSDCSVRWCHWFLCERVLALINPKPYNVQL